MAITLRGEAENSAANGGNVTVTMPGGLATNDVVICASHIGSNADEAMSTSSSGWSELTELTSNDSRDSNLGVYRKVMGGTPDSSIVLVGDADSSNSTAAVLQAWIGVDTTTPEDATTTTATGIDDNVPNGPSITTVTADALVISIGGSTATTPTDTAVTSPSGYSDQIYISQEDDRSSMLGMASKSVASPGAENPAAWTGWGSGGTGESWCAATVALRPAAVSAARSFGYVF